MIEPSAVRNLSFTVDYYHTTVDDVVGNMGVAGILAACYPAVSGSTATPAFCGQVHRAAGSGRILFVSDTNLNLGQLRTAGIDVSARYALPSPVGRFTFAFDGTWLAFFDRKQLIGTTTQLIKGKGNYDLGALPEYKANVAANWSFAGLGAGGVLNAAAPPIPAEPNAGSCGVKESFALTLSPAVSRPTTRTM